VARLSIAAAVGGLVVAALLHPSIFPVAVAEVVGIILLGAGAFRLPRTVPFTLLFASFISGLLLGAVRVEALTESALAGHAGEQFEVTVAVAGAVREKGGEVECPVEVRMDPEENALLRIRGAPDARVGDLLERGRLLHVKARVVLPEDPSIGFNEKQYLARRGMGVILECGSARVEYGGFRKGVDGLLDRVRSRSRRNLGYGLDHKHAGLLRGVVLGEKRGVPQEIMEDFRRSGVAHMLAVSGLHVGSLAAIFLGAFKSLPVSRRTAVLGSMFAVGIFVPFVGAGSSVVRAATMILLVLMAELLGRGRERWQALLCAALIILVRNPLDIYSAGFQLSFGAVVGLFLFVHPLENRLHFLPEGVATGVAVSAAATLGTAPVALVAFGQVSLVGVAANLLVVPVLPAVMGLGLAGMGLGFVWAPLAAFTNLLAALALEWTVRVAGIFARFPVLGTEDMPTVAAGLVGASLAAPVAARLGWERRKAAGIVLIVGACMGALLYPGALQLRDRIIFWSGTEGWPRVVETRVLDVGQGNATLLRTPEGKTVLVDGGPEGMELLSKLRRLGVRRLDLVVVSHPHADHFAGLSELVGAMPVGVLLDDVPGEDQSDGHALEGDEEAYLELRSAFGREGTELRDVENGESMWLGDESVNLVFHTSTSSSGIERSLNEKSVVVTVHSGGLDILLPGDAEADVLSRYHLTDADVIVVPHHGSLGAVRRELLEKLGVGVAVVSVGRDNTFGHPTEGTLSLLREQGILVLRTDREGWISLRQGGGGIDIRTKRRWRGSRHER